MKYIIFTFEGMGFSLAWHLRREGNDVVVGQVEDIKKTYARSESKAGPEDSLEKKLRLRKYKHIVPHVSADILIERLKKISNPSEYFVFFDSNNLSYYAEQIMHMGFHGNFPTEEDRLFEIDREAAKEFVLQHYPGLKITDKKAFSSIKDAKDFLIGSTSAWVLKSQNDAIQTFIPNTDQPSLANKQLIEMLDLYQDYYEGSGFLLEKKIASFVEITPEKLYYDGVPLGMTINFETKFLGSGDLSMQVACSKDLVFPVSMQSKIHDITFPPIVDTLAKQHKGLFIWDASLLIEQATGDIYFGEFCPNRIGYNCFFTELAQLPSVSHFFESVVAKKNPFTLGTVGASAMLFNLNRNPDTQNVLADASFDFPDAIIKQLWPYDIYRKTKTDIIRSVGYDIHLSPVTGSGRSIQEAVDNLYNAIKQISFSGVYYRPEFDYLSYDYASSFLNRLDYVIQSDLFTLPFKL